MTATGADVENAAPPSRSLLFALTLLTTVTAVVTSLGAPLVASIARDFDVSLAAAQWALTATMLTGAIATPVVGRLGAGRRRRPLILAGLSSVVVGCLLSALATGFSGFLAGRTLQGVGLAVAPLALAVGRDVLSPARMPSTMALLSVASVAGAGLGFPLTALVAGVGGVSAAFWLGAVITGLTLVVAWRHVPSSTSSVEGRFDWAGGVLLTSGTLALLLAISRAGTWAVPTTVALAGTGLVLTAVWVAWSLRVAHPLVDLRLAARPGAIGAHLTALLAGAGMYMGLTLVLTVVQAEPVAGWGLGLPVAAAGLMLAPYSLLSVSGSRVALAFGRRFSPERVLPVGCSVYLASNVLLAFAHDHAWQLLVVMAVAGLGSGCTFAMIPLLLIRAVPPEETSSSLGLQQVLRYIGFAIGSTSGVAVLGAASGPGGPDEAGLRIAALATAAVCALAGLIAWHATRVRG